MLLEYIGEGLDAQVWPGWKLIMVLGISAHCSVTETVSQLCDMEQALGR